MVKLVNVLVLAGSLALVACTGDSESISGPSPQTIYGSFTASSALYPAAGHNISINNGSYEGCINASGNYSCTITGIGALTLNFGKNQTTSAKPITVSPQAYINIVPVTGSLNDYADIMTVSGANCTSSSLSATPVCNVTFKCTPGHAGQSVVVNFQLAAPMVAAANINSEPYTFSCN